MLQRLVEVARDVVAEARPDQEDGSTRPDRPGHSDRAAGPDRPGFAADHEEPAEGPAAGPNDIELAYRVLADLETEGRNRTLHTEERLLAVVVFQRMADLATE